jgi:hypothetical protein
VSDRPTAPLPSSTVILLDQAARGEGPFRVLMV